MNDNRRIKWNSKLNDRGSTLITVIVAIAFVTILTSIILGTTVMNVRMKGIDKRVKDDFYYAEKALNDVYTGLGLELSEIAGERYEEAFYKIGTTKTSTVEHEGEESEEISTDYYQAELSEKEFRENFLSDAYDLVSAANLDNYITSRSKNEKVESVAGVELQDKNGMELAEGVNPANVYRVAIKGVKISSTDKAGFRSVITTDIIINIPSVDFLGTNVDVSDYALIANKGLYINGMNNADRADVSVSKITGNVYAGIHDSKEELTYSISNGEEDPTTVIAYRDDDYKEVTDDYSREKLFGGISIKDTTVELDGNYVVSKGDINLAGNNPKLRVSPDAGSENPTNMWFTSLRTLSEKTAIKDGMEPPITDTSKEGLTIDINANVFALNDLALNADRSSARFTGSYYGYDDATLDDGGSLDIIGFKRDDSRSSAIVINGSKVLLDMEGVNDFVLMGKAYIDFTSDNVKTEVAGIPADKQIVPTAEGLALQTNQQLYLVPNDFIDGPNPAVGGEPGAEDEIKFKINEDLDDQWFGFKYLDTSRGLDSIHKKFSVKQKDDDKWVYFDYLVFNDDIWMPDGAGGYKDEPDRTGKKLGTGGSISSKQKFFYDIMTATAASETDTETQPSAYRLKDRIDGSIVNANHFDLKQCVVGKGKDDANYADFHYYAKNAVINYVRTDEEPYVVSTVRENTEGMYRYADYPQNLFRRYKWLCTRLDGKEDILFGDGTTESTTVPDITDDDEWKKPSKNAPICHFIVLDNVDDNSINDMKGVDEEGEEDSRHAELKKEVYGACIAIKPEDGTLDLGTLTDSDFLVTGAYKGVVIVDGNIIVPAGMKVTGLLMATGTITLMGDNTIENDKGIIQSRIEKEINLVKNEDAGVNQSDAYQPYYLISYLSASDGSSLLYDVEPGTKIKRERIEADYNDFMHYENWQKGE